MIFCLDDVSIDTCEGSLNCHTIIELLLISPFMIFSVCLICWSALNVSAPMNCYISLDDLLIIMQCPSLSLSIFSNICIATLGFFWFPFVWNFLFHPPTFSLYVSLYLKWFSCRQYICEVFVCFFNPLSQSMSFGWSI